MKTKPILLTALIATAAILRAQDPAPPAPAPAAPAAAPAPAQPQSEMQKWIATTDAQWQAAFKRDIADWHEAELNKVKVQYISALEDRSNPAYREKLARKIDDATPGRWLTSEQVERELGLDRGE